jgi:DNA gyrase inhibitor GyrI
MRAVLFLIFLTIPNIAMSYETAKYEVTKTISDKIEIREYKNIVLATISQDGESQNNNFRTLFKFISGSNEREQEIKMTTPVFRQNISNKQSTSFVMPDSFVKDSIPKPNNKNIKIELLENTKFIVIRFSGRAVDKNFNKYQRILESAIKENGLKADLKNPINAYYNAPWTIPFFKRNEVLLRLN